jgi:nucleoside-diphosphate-sugar epimerase
MKVLVTGANGFVGTALAVRLIHEDWEVNRAIRSSVATDGGIAIGDIRVDTDWSPALSGCDAVVHLAARVHVMRDAVSDPLTAFRAVNVDGTFNLARQAAAAGVKRFIFLSSIKVNGEGREEPYQETDRAAPRDPYAISKWQAEQGLHGIAAKTGMEVVILRPPLVYGPGVKANFHRLLGVVDKGWPLPLGAIRNRRSLLYLGNLVDAIQLCLEHPAAAGQTYLLSDGEDVSSPELVRRLARAMGRPARLLPVPPTWLRLAGRLVGRHAEVERLLGSLVVDSGRIRRELGWSSPFSLDAGLAETARDYVRSRMAKPGRPVE